MRDITETMTFTTEEIRRENIKAVLREVSEALEEVRRSHHARYH